MTADVITFDQALAESDGLPRDILLGNGFSIAAHPKFAYGGLFQAADLDAEVRAIFAAARTTNFEAVMRYWLAEAFNESAPIWRGRDRGVQSYRGDMDRGQGDRGQAATQHRHLRHGGGGLGAARQLTLGHSTEESGRRDDARTSGSRALVNVHWRKSEQDPSAGKLLDSGVRVGVPFPTTSP
ncbi:MAG: DUF4917 family protein [Pseudomonadota bacterium]